MKRRDFMKSAGLLAGAVALGGTEALADVVPSSAMRLTIVHTNDVHSHLEPMMRGDFSGLGGAAERLSMINDIRAKYPNTLLLDAGDMFQGTPYFNIFKGEAEAVAMNTAGYVAGTIGNHEFDAGIERLAEVVKTHFKFPLLNCNYDFSDTPMKSLTREHMVVEMQGLRIGLLGLGIKMEGLVFPGYYGETRYLDPIANAQRVATMLRHDERCDFIVCLSHINLLERGANNPEPGDRDLIAEIPEIDLVIGGHNHYLIEPEAYWRRNGTGHVAQAGWAGTHLGLLQFDIYEKEKKKLAMGGFKPVRNIS